jgi:hypothetical protein
VLRIRDPVPFRPLDPGWVKNQQGIRIRDKQPGSYCRELRNKFFLVKILKFFDADSRSGMEKIQIRDLGWKKLVSGLRVNILDPQHCTFGKVSL